MPGSVPVDTGVPAAHRAAVVRGPSRAYGELDLSGASALTPFAEPRGRTAQRTGVFAPGPA
ncbi:hypothetical protein [Kitasatospora phosalacinea]|uniref:hypothetical protein n=1 Tax=Kitasatospora phosalacinea TaxID=2065 RepID=UPI000524ACC1|nr:hypothetical protein [Kitasatospora phosalacinea]